MWRELRSQLKQVARLYDDLLDGNKTLSDVDSSAELQKISVRISRLQNSLKLPHERQNSGFNISAWLTCMLFWDQSALTTGTYNYRHWEICCHISQQQDITCTPSHSIFTYNAWQNCLMTIPKSGKAFMKASMWFVTLTGYGLVSPQILLSSKCSWGVSRPLVGWLEVEEWMRVNA